MNVRLSPVAHPGRTELYSAKRVAIGTRAVRMGDTGITITGALVLDDEEPRALYEYTDIVIDAEPGGE